MPKTVNRLTPRNSLLTVDSSTGVRIPLRGNQSFSASNFYIDGTSLTLIVPSGYQFYEGERVLVEAMETSILGSGSVISASTNYSVANGTFRVSSFVSGVTTSSVTFADFGDVIGYTALSGSTSAQVTPVYTYDWELTGGSLSISTENYILNSEYVLDLVPNQAGEDMVLSLADVPLVLGDNGRRFSFNSKIKTNTTCDVTCTLSIDDDPISGGVESRVFAGEYATVRSNTEYLPDDESEHTVTITINISGHGGQRVYFTVPHLIDDEMYYSNRFVSGARSVMPDFYWDIDSQQENPIAPLHRLMDCLTVSANEIYDEFLRIYPSEVVNLPSMELQANPALRSSLVDPNHVDDRYAAWLGQFNGCKLKRNIVGSDGSNLLPNQETEREYVRWQIRTGYYGKNAGTRESIVEAAKQALIFTKDGEESTRSVALTAKYEDDIFKIRLQTLVNETPDVTVEGESSPMILDAVELARPMGYTIEHRAVNDFEFTVGDTTLGVLDAIPIGSTVD
jgi:hypothetical protein